MSPTGLRSVSSPKAWGGARAFNKPPPMESAAKQAQKKADEETQRRIRAWKAEQQAKEVGPGVLREGGGGGRRFGIIVVIFFVLSLVCFAWCISSWRQFNRSFLA